MDQPRGSGSALIFTFTPAEVELLRLEAERVRKLLRADRIFPKRVYEEERHEFVSEYMRGAFGTLTERQSKWAKRIKKELKSLLPQKAQKAQKLRRSLTR